MHFVLIVKEMIQPKRRSTLLEMVPKRFTVSSTSSASPKSPHRMVLPKPLPKDSAPLAGVADSPVAVASHDVNAAPELPPMENTLSPPSDSKKQKRWSVSDLPSLNLYNQDVSSLVGMLEQVCCYRIIYLLYGYLIWRGLIFVDFMVTCYR